MDDQRSIDTVDNASNTDGMNLMVIKLKTHHGRLKDAISALTSRSDEIRSLDDYDRREEVIMLREVRDARAQLFVLLTYLYAEYHRNTSLFNKNWCRKMSAMRMTIFILLRTSLLSKRRWHVKWPIFHHNLRRKWTNWSRWWNVSVDCLTK